MRVRIIFFFFTIFHSLRPSLLIPSHSPALSFFCPLILLLSSRFVRPPHLSLAVDAGGYQDAVTQPYPGALRGQIAPAMPAIELFKSEWHSNPGAGADPPGDLHISPAPLRMAPVLFLRQEKEPLHALEGKISGLMAIFSSSHIQSYHAQAINPFRREAISTSTNHPLPMAATSISIKIAPEMEEYIRARSTDMRIATTCEGPLIFSVKTSQPKPTDLLVTVGERRVYISAVQAPHIKSIDASMLPRCALEKKRRG